MNKAFWKTASASLGYLACAIACLIQWNSPNPLSRVDWFSGGYFFLRFVGSVHSIFSSLRAFRSESIREEWWALDSDPKGPRWVMVLMALDLAVFLDYGHWRVLPLLMRPTLQALGLTVYAGVTGWQIWTDAYLARYFNRTHAIPAPMNHGPYRYVRHPRYGAAIVGKVAMALIFGSLFGWLLVFAWGILLLKKIEVEEQHLRRFFGRSYELYARQTARVLPGIY